MQATDFVTILVDGMNGGVHPAFIPQTAYAMGINVNVSSGVAKTRPPFREIPLKFESPQAKATFERSRMQAAKWYQRTASDGHFIASVGGRAWAIFPLTGKCYDLTPDAGNNTTLNEAWIEQAGRYCVIQDGQGLPIIVDGSTVRRSNLIAREVPVGMMMAFGQNRLCVVLPNRREFQIGDIAGGATTPISFTDSAYLASIPAFQFPDNLGIITGCFFVTQSDTATGIGPLIIVGERGVIAMDLTVPRTQWATTDISRVVLIGEGGVGQRSLCSVNGDLFFRSRQGGVRSLRMARSRQEGWGKASIAREIDPILSQDPELLIPYTSAVTVGNRMMFTVNGRQTLGRPWFKGIATLNFDPVSTLANTLKPCWEGVWTGLEPSILARGVDNGIERLYVFANGEESVNHLFILDESLVYDVGCSRIPMTIETRQLPFDNAYALKRLDAVYLWLDDVIDGTTVEIKWRADGAKKWSDWKTRSISVSNGNENADCITFSNVTGSVSRLEFGAPPSSCGDGIESRFGYTFQFRITITGRATLRNMQATATIIEQPPFRQACGDTEILVSCGSEDWYSYNAMKPQIGEGRLVAVFASTNGALLDLTSLSSTPVSGTYWSIESTGTVYRTGEVMNGVMIGFPSSITALASSVSVFSWASNPYPNGLPT